MVQGQKVKVGDLCKKAAWLGIKRSHTAFLQYQRMINKILYYVYKQIREEEELW